MAAGRIVFPGLMPAVDGDGDRVAGAKAYFYENQTTTLADTYTSSALSTKNTNPVVADSVGVWPAMWADTATTFTVALTDADGAPIAPPWDGVSASLSATLASSDLAESAQAAAEAAQAAAETAQAAAEAAEAQAEASAAAISGAPFSATSTTSLTIGTGSKSLTLAQTGKLYSVGQTVVIARTAAPTNQMTGVITAFTSATGAMTVDVSGTAGSGTYTDWTISLTSAGGVQLVAGETGAVTADELTTALALVAADITDFNTAVDARAIAFAVAL